LTAALADRHRALVAESTSNSIMRTSASLKLNVVANYVGQFYVAAVNLVLLPVQVGLLGSEAYGLIGFFAMLSGWLQLLDIGLSPTLARETAKYRAGSLDGTAYRQLLNSVEVLFLGLGLAVSLVVLALSRQIAEHWLHREALSLSTVARAVAVMGFVFALRWQATLSRSVLVGLERQIWVNVINAVFATLRSVGVLAVLRWVEATPIAFFIYQAVVAAIELALLRIIVRVSLAFPASTHKPFSLAPLRSVAGFSLTVAFTSSVWVSVTQLDNLLLSKFLPLSEYAWFSLAVMAATGINLLAAPIGQAVQPRLTFLFATGNDSAFRGTYSDATQVLSAIALTASFIVAAGARPLLWAWTANNTLADHTAPVLSFYALGNGLMAVGAMTYYLQIARGDLRLHLKGNLVFAVVLIPVIITATIHAGMLGASLAWFGANLVFFAAWSAIVHRHFLPGLHLRWLFVDVLLPGAIGGVPALLLCFLPWHSLNRLATVAALVGIGLLAAGLASLATSPIRRSLHSFLTLHTRKLSP
jgi:O-antigen/teichoic acid export membrane protein